MKEKFEYFSYRSLIAIVSILPDRLLYIFSDFISFLLNYFIRYRRNVILENLRLSFPEKSKKELQQILRCFYHHIADVLLETLKSYSFSRKPRQLKFVVTNPEILDRLYEEKKSCVLMMSHYANWEWIILGTRFLQHKWCSIYKPLRNKKIDRVHLKHRRRFGMHLFPQSMTGAMVRNNLHEPAVFTYVSDQSPAGLPEQPYWIPFLNRLTACHSGAEKLAVKFNLPVFYLDIQRVKRGNYSAEIIPLCINPSETKPGDITAMYMRQLEKIIHTFPENWLWSHKRWKKQPPSGML
jgi:Kdo2-lipid IVA lauroyltransferase/acyltransferase